VTYFSSIEYGVLAPCLLGYGDTGKPTSLSDYRDKKMAAEKDGYWKLFEKEDAVQIVIGSVNPSSPTR
jgi:hypothetical protein